MIYFVVMVCFFRKGFILVCLAMWLSGVKAQQNPTSYDHSSEGAFGDLIAPAPAAGSSIDFDGLGWMVSGNRVFIQAGTLQYSRVPQPSWREMLLALKRGGCNTVTTYVFWNYHEAKEGSMDFTTEGHNLGLFLDLAKESGLYVIIHAGPYTGSQWENGGLPTWLYFKEGMEIRTDNKPYLDAVDAWFAKLLPILATRQINHSGNVIAVQFEDQLPTVSIPYAQHLLDQAKTDGIEVPIYFNGLHVGKDPAPDSPIDHAHRKAPWISTAFWTTWFNRYGTQEEDFKNSERNAWKILAMGGNGLDVAMFYGGTNFDVDGSEDVGASYDFGAPIGQGGNPRSLYFSLKRLGYFAASFSNILSGSMDATEQYQDFGIGAKITARTSQGGTLVFLDNTSAHDTTVILKNGSTFPLGAGEIAALALQIPLASGLVLSEADTRLLSLVAQDTVTTLVCYGNPGQRGKLIFGSSAGLSFSDGTRFGSGGADVSETPAFDPSGILTFQYPHSSIWEEYLRTPTAGIRVLIMSKATADKVWVVDDATGKLLVAGPPMLGDFSLGDTSIAKMTMDYPWDDTPPTNLMVYGKTSSKIYPIEGNVSRSSADSLKLSSWDMANYTYLAEPRMNDKSWFSLTDGTPPEMGQDGDYAAYTWYRAHVTLTAPLQALEFTKIGDRATLFVDGKRAGAYDIHKDARPAIAAVLPAGPHDLALFVAHAGRPSLAATVGAFHTLSIQKGLRGPVRGVSGTWKLKGGVDPNAIQLHWTSVPTPPEPRAGRRTAHEAVAPEQAPTFYRTHFMLGGDPEPGAVYRMITTGLSEGCVWINSHLVGRYPEILSGCPGIWLPAAWLRKGSNTLTILDESGAIPTAVSVQLEKTASRHRVTVKPLSELQGIFQ